MLKIFQSMKIGMKIKRLRELKNYTQEYMADRLMIGATAYGNIERDTTKDMSLERLLQIAYIFEIDFTEIINFDLDKPFSNTPTEQQKSPSVPDQDDWHGRFIVAIVEQCMKEKQMMYELMLSWRNDQQKLERHLQETTQALQASLALQQEMHAFLFNKK